MSKPYLYFTLLLIPTFAQNCQNGGSYQDGICKCLPHFEGENCQHRNCVHGTRQNDGSCKCKSLSPKTTPGGWEGEFCDLPKCVNGARVNDSCVCSPNYAGVFCEGVSLCLYGRSESTAATDEDNRYESYKCVCTQHWEGPFCDTIKCPYGRRNVAVCECNEGYYGEYCEKISYSRNDDDYEWDSWDNPHLPYILIFVGLIVVGLTALTCYLDAKKRGLLIEGDESPKPEKKACNYEPVAYTELSMPVGADNDPRISVDLGKSTNLTLGV